MPPTSSRRVLVSIPAGEELTEPITLTSTGRPGELRPLRHRRRPNSRATVVMDHQGDVTVAANVEIGARRRRRADPDQRAGLGLADRALAAHGALLNRDASYRHIVGQPRRRGGPAQRRRCGSPARAAPPSCTGCPSAGDGQHQESRLYVDHAMPNCTSNVVYKSVLDGDTARTVWIGDVRIRPAAVGTRTYELNRNLLLTDGARADSVPNLEIETGEIAGAGHASATGRFDDLQLFYLQSRGIPRPRGPPAGGARVLRRRDRPDRGAAAARPADGQHRRPAGCSAVEHPGCARSPS